MMFLLSFMNLFRNKRRTLAILLTIAMGTGVLFSFMGFIHGVLNQYRDSTIHSHYGHGQINTKDYRETVYSEPWSYWLDNGAEIEQFLSKRNDVEHVFPRVNFTALLKNGNISFSGFGQGISANLESSFFYGLNVEQGETLSTQEEGILLGLGLAKALGLKPQDEVTLLVNAIDGSVSEAKLTVSGIFHTGNMDFDNRMFRIQLPEAQKLLKTDKVELIALGLKDTADWDQFAKEFETAFPKLEATSFAVLDKVYYQHSVDWLNAQFHVIQVIILSIVLLGIFNSISGAILERKQEIGNFRANGESISDVMRLIVMEGTFLGVLGGLLGIGISFVVMTVFLDKGIMLPPGPGLTRPFLIAFKFEPSMVYTTLGLSSAASVIASLLAGIRVAKMPIASALRSYS